jgi:hypothetical protein
MMNFREGQSIRYDRLAQLLVGIRLDVGGIEESRLGSRKTSPRR